MHPVRNTWGIVLAGGDGRRLQSISQDDRGTVVPKQYCSFQGGRSLFRTTVERLAGLVDRSRIVAVVAASHRRWWESEVTDLDPDHVIVQPCDRGTACGVLLPLIYLRSRDPMARIVVSPSDHFIDDEETFQWALIEAAAHVDSRPRLLVLLGVEPDSPVSDYGWILPSEGGEDAVQVVTSFVEKPDTPSARRLMETGALWSSFTFVTTAEALMTQFKRTVPWLAERFVIALGFERWDRRHEVLIRLYDKVPTVDFSRQVLQESDERIHVLPVPPCGWTDLGTPERVAACARRVGGCPFPTDELPATHRPRVDLASRSASLMNARTDAPGIEAGSPVGREGHGLAARTPRSELRARGGDNAPDGGTLR